MLSRAHDDVVRYLRELPNFACTRVTRRFDNVTDLESQRPEVWGGLRLTDISYGELSYDHGVENLWDETGALAHNGLKTFGEFGSMMGTLFVGNNSPRMFWSHWETFNLSKGDRLAERTRLAVFAYLVPATYSRYTVSYCCVDRGAAPTSLKAAYGGDVYMDAETGTIFRITRRALDLPRGFPIKRAETLVDFRPVPIGSGSFLAPVRSATISVSQIKGRVRYEAGTYLNDVRFLRYRRIPPSRGFPDNTHGSVEETRARNEEDPWRELLPEEKESRVEANTPVVAQPSVTIRTSSQLVEVPIVVSDAKGKPISDLKPHDFDISDNGRRQSLRLFAVDRGAAPRSSALVSQGKRLFSNREASDDAPQHVTVILLDQINTNWADLVYARRAIIQVLHQIPASAHVGIYVMGWGSLSIIYDLSNNAAGLANQLPWDRGTYTFAPLTTLAVKSKTGYARTSMAALRSLSKHLSTVPGRKNVLWLTAGFSVSDSDNESYNLNQEFQETVRILNDANVAVYAIEAPGLQTGFDDPWLPPSTLGRSARTASAPNVLGKPDTLTINSKQASMLELAATTGGRAFINANDLAGAIQTAFDDPRPGYRLGYYPGDLKQDGAYHEIRVNVPALPQARLRYRHGYFDEPQGAPPKIRDLLLSPTDAVGIPLSGELISKGEKCQLTLKIGVAVPQTSRLQIALLQRGYNGEQLETLEQTVGFGGLRDEAIYRREFRAKSGASSLRVAVRDAATGRAGSVTIQMR
jgi:VWFA-related protein